MTKPVKVSLGMRDVFLVGTAHVSDESVRLVRDTIEKEMPDVVAVELCEQRHQSLMDGKKWDETEITEVIKTGRTHLFLIQLLLANFQRRIGDTVGVKPGAEMKKAVDIAREKGIRVELVDRNVKVTLKRAFDRMSLSEKSRMLYDFISGMLEGGEINKEVIEKLKKKDLLTEMLEEMSREMPSVKKVLIDERDEYIAHKISMIKGKRIVAVVGAGHVDGITKNLKKETGDIGRKIKKLEETREKKSMLKYAGWGVIAAIVLLVSAGFLTHGVSFTWELVLKLFLVQGTLAALGATLALAHPVTIVATFISAPFALLHPLIAVGWISALVELKMRKPLVKDFNGLLKLNGIGDYWKNRITRIFLVLLLTNGFATLGTAINLVLTYYLTTRI
jgi:pheromone shutdown-related protein TraB